MSQKLFLSTSTNEFGRERKRLAELLQSTNRVHVLHQEKFTQHGTTLLTILAEIEEADIVLQILGYDLGDTPKPIVLEEFLNDPRLSKFKEEFPDVVCLAQRGLVTYTQWETWLAVYLKKHLWLYQVCPASANTGGAAPNSNAMHLARLNKKTERFPSTAATAEGMCDVIIKDLIRKNVLARPLERWLARVASGIVLSASLGGIVLLGKWLAPPPSFEITLSRVRFTPPGFAPRGDGRKIPGKAPTYSGLNKSPLESAKVLLEQSIFESIAWDRIWLSAEHAAIMSKMKRSADEHDVVFSVLCEPTEKETPMVLPKSVEVTFHGNGTEQAVLVVGRDGGFPDSNFLLIEPEKDSVDGREANPKASLRFELSPWISDDSSMTRAERRTGFAVIVLQPRFDPPIEAINLKTIPR